MIEHAQPSKVTYFHQKNLFQLCLPSSGSLVVLGQIIRSYMDKHTHTLCDYILYNNALDGSKINFFLTFRWKNSYSLIWEHFCLSQKTPHINGYTTCHLNLIQKSDFRSLKCMNFTLHFINLVEIEWKLVYKHIFFLLVHSDFVTSEISLVTKNPSQPTGRTSFSQPIFIQF